MQTKVDATQKPDTQKRGFTLQKRDGSVITARIPPSWTVGQALGTLAARAGYEPTLGDQELSYRLAVRTGKDERFCLVPEHKAFGDLPEGSLLTVVPSLAPAAVVSA
jgi:hypothetical protein